MITYVAKSFEHVLRRSPDPRPKRLTAPGKTARERRRAALAAWSAMVGAVTLARIADDPVLSEEILSETRKALGGH
jgi:hypothetical protein